MEFAIYTFTGGMEWICSIIAVLQKLNRLERVNFPWNKIFTILPKCHISKLRGAIHNVSINASAVLNVLSQGQIAMVLWWSGWNGV